MRLNEHWFISLAHAQQVVIEPWRREYNDERPKNGLGRLTPTAYARQLTEVEVDTKVTDGLQTNPLLKGEETPEFVQPLHIRSLMPDLGKGGEARFVVSKSYRQARR